MNLFEFLESPRSARNKWWLEPHVNRVFCQCTACGTEAGFTREELQRDIEFLHKDSCPMLAYPEAHPPAPLPGMKDDAAANLATMRRQFAALKDLVARYSDLHSIVLGVASLERAAATQVGDRRFN